MGREEGTSDTGGYVGSGDCKLFFSVYDLSFESIEEPLAFLKYKEVMTFLL